MKSRIVLWGTKDENEKVLLGLELKAKENKVLIHIFPEKSATEVFYNLLMNEWRENREVEFPEDHQVIDRPLTAAESILPEHIKVQRTDVVQRAQSEWHFVVLSAKLKDVYDSEIGELKERIRSMTGYENGVWEELKGFWSKVQGQIRDRTLFRGHANSIKKEVNELFDELKQMRSKVDDELKEKSEEVFQQFNEKLDVIEEKIEKGLGLQPLFNDLKSLQRKFKESDLVRRHQNQLWKRIDSAFKSIKKTRFGDDEGGNSRLNRLQSRYDGLVKAINRMKSSIGRDKKDIEFEEDRIDRTDGQLEAQLRTAKLNMINERIESKQIKLDDMLKTEAELSQRIEKEKQQIEKEKLLAQAQKEAREKIAQKVDANKEKLAQEAEKLEEAAQKIKEARTEVQSPSPSVSAEVVEDIVAASKVLDEEE